MLWQCVAQFWAGDARMAKVLISLHGINTRADWQRPLSALIRGYGWEFPFEDWYFGHFSIIRFLIPRQREAIVRWFRDRYSILMRDNQLGLGEDELPSIVA